MSWTDRGAESWVLVGRIGRPHGIKGELTVELRTDSPELRFATGVGLLRLDAAPLTVTATRWHQGTLLVSLEGVHDRNSAEALKNTAVYADPSADLPSQDGSFADRELIGLPVITGDGDVVGNVTEVLHPPGQDMLAVRGSDGREHLIPFVLSMVPEVDLVQRRIVITPPPGLLDL